MIKHKFKTKGINQTIKYLDKHQYFYIINSTISENAHAINLLVNHY